MEKTTLKKWLSEYSNSAVTLEKKNKNKRTRKPEHIKMLPKNNKNANMGMWYIQNTGKALSRTTFANANAPKADPRLERRRELGKLYLLSLSFLQCFVCCSSQPVQKRQPLQSHFSGLKRECFD